MDMKNAKPGHSVEFFGLKGAAHLNGKKGHIVKFDKKEQRWVVKCDDDKHNIVRAKVDNLRRVHGDETHEDEGLHEMLHQHRAANAGRPNPPPPKMITSSRHGDVNSLNETVLDSYFKRKMGGAVVFFDDEYMLAVEFFGPRGARCAEAEMVYVGRDRSARAVVQQRGCASAKELGRNFLLGETTEYIEATNESSFFALLARYTNRAKSKSGLIDMKSGLKIYEAALI